MKLTKHQMPYSPRVDLIIKADGHTVQFDDISSLKSVKTEVGDYSLKVCQDQEDVLSFGVHRRDGKLMDVECLDVMFTVPLLNFSKVILPDCGREYILRDKSLFLRSLVTGVSAPNDGHPFVALLDQSGNLAASFGILSNLRESTCRCLDPLLSARKALLGGHDVLKLGFRLPSSGWSYGRTKNVSEKVFLGGLAFSWFHALRRYSELGQKLHNVNYPQNPAAWDPTWCTWTAWCSEQLCEDALIENARIAIDLGIKSIIIDDGWFGPGLDTDTKTLNIGDYYPDPVKFPDLPGTVRKLQNMGLRVLLWYAPTCIAPESLAYPGKQNLVMKHQGKPVLAPNGFYNLCPCNPEVRSYVRDEITRMMRDYGIDGFKVDLYNTLPATPCDADHSHDVDSVIDGVHMMMDDIWEVTKKANPDALLELKQNYGNFLAARYGTMVRAGDTAYDTDSNFWRCLYIQAYAPVTHNDYLACSVHDTPRDIALMMIKQLMGGVPTFSIDLPRQPQATINVIRGWLEFYRRKIDLLKCSREPQSANMDTWQILGQDEALVCALFSAGEISLPDSSVVTFLNGTGREQLYIRVLKAEKWSITRFNCDHSMKDEEVISLKDGDSLAVPSGGGAVLKRINA